LLGDAAFKKGLHEFINRWHGKHPMPWDMFYTFNDASGQNLNWFWSNWFFTNNYIDLAVKEVSASSKGTTVTVENIGGYVAPFDIAIIYADGTKETVHQTPAVWKDNQKMTTVKITSKKKVQSIVIDGGIFMDANTKNNSWKAN
jgi:aminopeptidase N